MRGTGNCTTTDAEYGRHGRKNGPARLAAIRSATATGPARARTPCDTRG